MVSVFGFRLTHGRRSDWAGSTSAAEIAKMRRQHRGDPALVDSMVEAPRIGALEQARAKELRLEARLNRKTPRIPSAVVEASSHFKKYPELAWLTDSGLASRHAGLDFCAELGEGSYSQSLGQTQFFPALERRLQSLRCLSLIVDGCAPSHEEFVRRQPSAIQLRPEAFEMLHAFWKKIVRAKHPILHKHELLRALQTALVLGDIGKSPKVREQMKALGITDPNHDNFYAHVMRVRKARETLPSFSALNKAQQNLVRANIGSTYLTQLTHCEGGSAMYEQLRLPTSDAYAVPFDFSMLVHVCNMAGALGHKRNQQGSLTHNAHADLAIQDTLTSCSLNVLVFGSALKAYDKYLSLRAQLLGLSPSSKTDQLLARLAAMLELFTPEDGKAIWLGYFQLSEAERAQALALLLPEGVPKDVSEGAAMLPCMPIRMRAVLVNLHKNASLGESREDRLKLTVQIGVPCISRALQAYLALVESGEMGGDVALNFKPIARVATSDPHALAQREVKIDPATGAVTLTQVRLQC
jgi:hypothetical protein